jgi:trehalose 6-phosphate phosphatase
VTASEVLADRLPRPEPLRPDETALFLDLDGTLAAIEPRPDQVVAEPERTHLLGRLAETFGGRLAVISGRALDDIDRILDGTIPALAGVHGLQRRRADGSVVSVAPSAALTEARHVIIRRLPAREGLLIEDKGVAMAIHYRQAPECAGEARALAEETAARFGLEVQYGDMVVELRPPGADKGDAISAFMAEPPFAGSTPVFVGDDLTDENGFRAVGELGGYGVLVGPQRMTLAACRLGGVDEVMAWLERALIR